MKRKLSIIFMLGFLTMFLLGCDLFGGGTTTTTTAAVTTTAVTTVLTYDIAFNSMGGITVADGIYLEGESTVLPEPTKTGYTFDGWYLSDSYEIEFTLTSIPIADITLYAKWKVNEYTITFESNLGSVVTAITQDYLTTVTEPTEPTREEYIFIDWYSDIELATAYTFTIMPAEDITLYAKWDANEYTLTFESNLGSAVTALTQDFGTTVTEPTEPTRAGYSFIDWYGDIELTTAYIFTTMPVEDIMIYAKWEINENTLTFESNLGSAVTALTQDFETAVTEPTEPTRIGYTFIDWYSDIELNTAYTFTTMPAEDMTLYAKWNANEYTLTFNSNLGSAVTALTQDFGTTVTKPTEPTRTGYSLNGWYDDSSFTTLYVFGTMPAEDITLYAKWTINQYTITFVTNDESVIAPITQDYATLIIGPNNPTKTGYTFAGWYEKIELTDFYEFSTMPAKNITLYADWGTEGLLFTLNDEYYSVSLGAANDLADIIIPKRHEGILVTEIADEGFKNSNMTSVFIPSSVITIGATAFGYNSLLVTVTFEEGSQLETIRHHAFDSNTSLTTIAFPDSLTDIAFGAFWGATALTDIILPSSLVSIGNESFYGTYSFTTITIPSSVTSIGRYAFCNSTITSLIFEENSQLISIGEFTFYNTEITSLMIPASVEIIDRAAFAAISTLLSIEVDANNLHFMSENGVLFNYDETRLVQYPSGKIDTNYVIPNGVTSISNGAFIEVTLLTDLTIPNTLLAIDAHTFEHFYSLVNVTFEENSVLQSIGDYAFSSASNLSGIIIPASVTSIGDYAFANDSKMAYFIFEEGSMIAHLGNSALAGRDVLKSIFLPSSIVSIGTNAFDSCWELTIFVEAENIPAGWDSTWNSWDCSVVLGTQEIKENAVFTYALLSTGNAVIIGLSTSNIETDIIIPNTLDGMVVNRILNKAFEYNTMITSVHIPATVTQIEDRTFNGAYHITTITFEANSQLTSIGENAFEGNWDLISIIIPEGVLSIGNSAFNHCVNLSTIIIPVSVDTMGSNVFANTNSELTINVVASSIPVGWDVDWNPNSRTVVLSYVE